MLNGKMHKISSLKRGARMKLKKLGIFGCCLLASMMLASCDLFNKKEEPKPPVQEQPVVSIESLELKDEDDNKLEKDQAYVGIPYRHNGIEVIAHYSDDSTKNVTSYATFSEVDTTKTGSVTCTVSYQQKEATYVVEVLEDKGLYLQLDSSKIHRLYKIGEFLSLTDLIVQIKYASGLSKLIQSYSITVLDENKKIHDIKDSLAVKGKYTIQVEAESLKNEFDVYVYDDAQFNDILEMASLATDLSMPDNGIYSYTGETMLYQKGGITLKTSPSGTSLETKSANGQPLNKQFDNKTYHGLLRMPSINGLSLTLEHDTEIVLIAAGDTGIGVQFEANGKIYYPARNVATGMRLSYIKLAAGSYRIQASYQTIELYELRFFNEALQGGTEETPDIPNIEEIE